MQLAAQMYTLREFTETSDGLDDALAVLHGIGYSGVQLSAVGCMNGDEPEVDAYWAREMLESHGLVCCATHRPWARLRDHLDEEIEFHQVLGCDYIALGWIANDFGMEPDGYRRFVEEATPLIQRLKEVGIRFGYHNHAHEFVRDPKIDRPAYDILIDEATPDLKLEIDTYWVAHAGADVRGLLERCAGRIEVIHAKDREVVIPEGPVMAPVGEGLLDWTGILAACKNGGTEWVVVEQDVCRRDPFDCLESSYAFLISTGEFGI